MSNKAARARRRSKDRSRPQAQDGPAAPAPRVDTWRTAVVLAGAVFIAYLPAIQGAFLWDDDAHVTRPELRSVHGLWRIWSDLGATQQYYPLLHSAFWLEHRLWGNAPIGYHLVNILFHAASAWLLLHVLRRLEIPGAPLAAAIFALHPVHAESVAWITEQKNTLSMVLYLGAMDVYLRFDQERRRSLYLLASGLFVCGLLTKTVVATLPGALLVIAWWRRARLSWRQDVLPLVPWLALGAGAGLLTAWIERNLLGAEGADFTLTFLDRGLLAGRVIWFYLGKLFWPTGLLFTYPRWAIGGSAWPRYLFAAWTLAVLAAFWMVRGRSRAPLAVALFFVGTLFPVLGFINVYPFVFSFVADHFQYLPSLGIITAVAAAVATLVAVRPKARRVAQVASVALVGTLGALTWRQSRIYSDPQTLYEATLRGNPDCYLCLNNLGTLAIEAGRPEEAVEQFRRALRIKPDSAEAHNNLGTLLVQSGSVAEGIDQYEQALKAAPNNVMTHTNLGIALFSLGRMPEARSQFEAALRIMPDYAPARQNLYVIEEGVQNGGARKQR